MSYTASDTQGNVVRGYRHMRKADYVFCAIESVKPARALLRKLVPTRDDSELDEQLKVRTDEDWRYKANVNVALNVAFTFPGLLALGWGSEFERFEDFQQGMYARARDYLGDDELGEWGPPTLYEGADLLFTIYYDNEPGSSKLVHEFRAHLHEHGLRTIFTQQAQAIDDPDDPDEPGKKDSREHFGFRDGFSQPALQGVQHAAHRRRVVGEGVLPRPFAGWDGARWRGLRLGEILLGHKDEDGVIAGGEEHALRNGTFMVWRKIEQDVDAFEKFFERAGSPEDREFLKAKVVGRWPDGTSVLEPHRRRLAAAPGARPRNDFDYGDDPTGAGCPLGAHVRRANPRTSLKWWTLRTCRHRIIRRGMPYAEGTGVDERFGLIFVCFNASITRQFEMIQRFWLRDGDAFGLGSDSDFMLGSHDAGAKMVVDGDGRHPPVLLDLADRRFVTVRGGYYLFVPGIAALRLIARGPAPTKRWWHRVACA